MATRKPNGRAGTSAAGSDPTRRVSTLALGRLVLAAAVAAAVVVAGVFAVLRSRNGESAEVPPSVGLATPSTGQAAAAAALVPDAVGPVLEVYPTGALHVVGQERFAVGLIDPESGPVESGKVDLLFVKLAGNEGTLTEQLDATFMPYGPAEGHTEGHESGSDITGVFAARPTFDAPGQWGVVARVTLLDGTRRAGQVEFAVAPDTLVPGPGEAAIASKTLTARTPDEESKVCTAESADGLHALSLDEALRNGKPTVLLFATPAMCASRTCGPSLAAVEDLRGRYGANANFVHVEIYPGRSYEEPAAAVTEWNLPSEPWLFLIDGAGRVVERYEGGIGIAELEPAVRSLVA